MLKQATFAAAAIAVIAAASTGASAQPGISSLAQAAPVAGEANGITKVGWSRGRLKSLIGKYRWRQHLVQIGPNCNRFLKLYKATGNERWKNKFDLCKQK